MKYLKEISISNAFSYILCHNNKNYIIYILFCIQKIEITF